jgi:predicted DNA-binding transcriptional regulator YafY
MEDLPEEIINILDGRSVVDIAIKLLYKNWRGESSERNIIPISIKYGSNEYHKDMQWLMRVYDLDKNDYRDYSLRDINEWIKIP